MNGRPADNRPSPARPLTRARVTRSPTAPTLTFVAASWDYEDFAAYLRALMDSVGIADYAELSRRADVSQTQLSNWRRGLARPSREALKKVAAPLRVEPRFLFIRAGLDTEEDWKFENAPDYLPLPKPVREIRDAYERLKALGREDYAATVISTTTAILEAEIAKLEDIDNHRRDHPSGRRRAG